MSRTVQIASMVAVAGTVHAAINARLMRRPDLGARGSASVSVLVPARDEAAHIGDCLRALRLQDVAEILVLDDGSTDGTAETAASAAAGDARARVLTGAPLPDGWLGKPHACAQLAEAADPSSNVLVFLDADVILAPGAISAAVALLERTQLDLITPHPREVAVSLAERLVQPLLQWSFLTTLPLRLAERSSRPSLGAANGQFLVVRRDTYARAGGHAAVADAVLDDLALLRAVKAVGGHGSMVDGTTLAACRMYDDWPTLRDGYGKSLWSAFGSDAGAVAVVGSLGFGYVLPAVAAVRGSRVGLIGYLAAVAGRVITARTTGSRIWPDALAHPISIAVFGYLTARSLVQRRRGALLWKGRPVREPGRGPAFS
jgi:glycosyltransferase involved in cell wall biosynthesis